MNIAFGHTNMDLDCLGSLILIKKLYPDYRLVRSKLIHPAAQNLYTLYNGYFDFLNPKELEREHIKNIIIVDTCMADRVSEYFTYIRGSSPRIRIIDHHPPEHCDILGAQIEGGRMGANTSYLGKLAMQRGLRLAPEEATIALTGIYADTGRLIYENVCKGDFEVAAWLIDMGASLKLVRAFLETINEDSQIEVLNRLLRVQMTRNIQGHVILAAHLELEENVPGLAAVVEKIMELENPDAYFAMFSITKTKTVLLIARSRKPKIDLHHIMQEYGGGGHQAAASAKITGREGSVFYEEFFTRLEQILRPATRAADIMSRGVSVVQETMSLLEASRIMEQADVSGVPVLNDRQEVTGFISLRDIMKGRRTGSMELTVRAYMTRPVISAASTVTMREIERILFKHHVGQIPIVENQKLLGIVTRRDYLEYKKKQGI
ncbi:MAG: CBS domain-containing protein [Spirochaetales bacterium]|jgi:tRNA nucleotidyltransferase (CCA-adding enzyme)|nr:CBS domain-containing protein [Spirochaetales bacterium]